MQGAQASCSRGGSDPPDIPLPSPSLSKIPPRPSLSLELFDRFAEDIQSSSSSLPLIPSSDNVDNNPYSPMDFESDDPVPGISPLVDDATDTAIASSSLSERSCITYAARL